MSALKRGGSGQTATNATPKPSEIATPKSDKWEQWLQFCNDNGVIPVALKLGQWARTNAPHKSYTNTSLAVMLKDDCIHVKDWTSGENHTFFDYRLHTPAELRVQQAERLKIQQVAERLRNFAHAMAAQQALALWRETTVAPVSGYLALKGLSGTHGARCHVGRQCWMVKLTDAYGKIGNIQSIYNEKRNGNDKWYFKGARKTGLMVPIGALHDNIDQVLVCEGFATGATLREKTGKTVVCAMDCGNLQPVCEALRAAYPQVDIVVCGDDDRHSDQNRGRQMAIAAAKTVGGRYCFPTFDDNCTSCTDFNDVVNCTLCGGEL